jgi:DNA primase
MQHPAAQLVPIVAVAAALGMRVEGRKARCFNGAAHKSGADEKPALTFLTDVNRFKCYVCGARGDAISLVQGVLGVPFGEAVRWLSELAGRSPAGLSAPNWGFSARTPTARDRGVYARLYEESHDLGRRSPCGRYLRGRGIDLDLANRCEVAELLDPAEVWEVLNERFDEAELKAAGLISRRGYFLFARHPLLFFHFDEGAPQFVLARDISGEALCKELSPAGLRSPVPYLGDMLRQKPERILVCEGCIDALSATQLGYAAVGVPGVIGFQDDWFKLFHGAGQVTILFDNDDAGRRQSAELRSRFRMRGIRADSQFPREGKDLNDLLKALVQKEGKHG